MITEEQLSSACFEQIIPKWHSMPDTFPDFLPVFSQEEKRSNGGLLREAYEEMNARGNNTQEQRKEIKKKLHEFIEKENILQIKKYVPKELLKEFEESAEGFAEKAIAFDKTISEESLWQAMRNYLIYSMIVNLQGQRQNCMDAILGYSLLYPYTDNYIDKPHKKKQDKAAYNDLIRKTLSGRDVLPQNEYEKKTKQLIRMVLDYYSENSRKQKEASSLLLLMLKAQEKSVMQIQRFGATKLSYEEILRISAFKGGLSVFLDYLFAIDFDTEAVTEEEQSFYLCFGLILQLADDLQDVAEDRKGRIRTIMTYCKDKKEREAAVNRLFHFAHDCIARFSPQNPQLHTFLLRNCQLMLLAAVAQSPKYFSRGFLEKIETHLPVPGEQLQDYYKQQGAGKSKSSAPRSLFQFHVRK